MRLSPLLLLVSVGKNVALSDDHGNEPDDVNASIPQQQLQVAKLLLYYGARPNAKDVCGKTVVHYGAGAMATETTLKIVDLCCQAHLSSHLFHQHVQIHGLQQESHNTNGKRGIVQGFDVTSGRRLVQLTEDDTLVKIKPEHLTLVSEDGSATATTATPTPLCDIPDRLGCISLLEVLPTERMDVTKFLLSHNVQLDRPDCEGVSPLSLTMHGMVQMASPIARLIQDHHMKITREARKKRCTQCQMVESDTVALSACSACKIPRYCSKECQTIHWKQGGHKTECQQIVERKNVGVLLQRPKKGGYFTVMSVDPNNPRTKTNTSSGSFKKPKHVAVGEKFVLKVQVAGTKTHGTLLLYDKTRQCLFYLYPHMEGYAELWEAGKAERATNGTLTYMKAMFDATGHCIAFPHDTSIYTW